jgi:hypothetical protein
MDSHSIFQLVIGFVAVACAFGGFFTATQFSAIDRETGPVTAFISAIICGISIIALANGAPVIISAALMLGSLGAGVGLGLAVRRNNPSD